MPSNRADARSVFGPTAERYAQSAIHGSPKALARLVEIVQPRGGRVLDVATGSGHTAIAFAPYVNHVVASDFTPDMLKVCRREAAAKGIKNLTVCIAHAECLPFRTHSFQGVTVRLAPHHFASVDSFLREAHRVLKPGGWLLVSDTVGPEDPEANAILDRIELLRDPSHASDLSVSDWKRRLAESGFELRHDEENRKTMEAQEWLDRLDVPAEIQAEVLELMRSSTGELRKYMAPKREGGKDYFDLDEHAFFAVKP